MKLKLYNLYTDHIHLNIYIYIIYNQSDIIGDGQGIINLTFFTFMVLFLFSPIVTQFFGGDFQDIGDWDDPGMKFDNFYQSFLALYQVLTNMRYIILQLHIIYV